MAIALDPNSENSSKAQLAIQQLDETGKIDSSITTNQTVKENQPVLEIGKSCSFALQYKDKGSGGNRDISIYDPKLENGFRSVGSYPQGNYDKPGGCVTVVKALVDKLPNGKPPLANPAGYRLVWDDKKSGADMDGSVWHPTPPNNDYVCIGSVGQAGYKQPDIPGYACVHKCLVKPATKPSSIIWTDEGTGAKSRVTIFQLPVSRVIYAVPERNSNITSFDLDPAGMCQE